ncbi:unnamed protein product [Durusdinium trenchii]|uniref:Uncharacterized protein n=1 Tax=Durusdinium trenchii TaxID=1381693 RepID=A0ABP0NX61_9DINO
MRAALTDAADGVLRPGALPSTSAVGKDGNKALLDALGKAVAIAKPKRSKERDGLVDPVKPQTTEEKLSSYMQDLLAHAATARTQSIKLSTVGYATELSAQLLDHAKKLEVTFKTGQDALKIKDEKEMTALIKKVDKLIAFGDQAKAAAAAFLRPSSKGRAKAKAKANTKTTKTEKSSKALQPRFRGQSVKYMRACHRKRLLLEPSAPLAAMACTREIARGISIDGYVHILLPHELLHCLAKVQCNSVFDAIILGHLNAVSRRKFWEHVKEVDAWRLHPIFDDRQLDMSTVIPLCVHGDGAEMKRDDESFVWSFSSFWGSEGQVKDVLMYKYPFAIILERHMKAPNVRSAVEKVIAEVFGWSMKCCSSGIAYMALELVPSPWTAVPGFRLETIAWDLLHNVFLGTGRDLVASAIRVLIREGIYDHVGSSELDVILSAVHEEIRTTCKQNGFLYQECFPLV